MVCCGQPMTLLVANSVDASKEKHVPVYEKGNGHLDVTIGAISHPMLPEHHIEWIALVTDSKFELIYLKPDGEPKAQFLYSPSGEAVKVVNVGEDGDESFCEGSPCNFSYNELVGNEAVIYEYCNLHGLWKTTL